MVRDDSLLGTGTKSALCAKCGTCFTSPTSFDLHQTVEYDGNNRIVVCAQTPEELKALGLTLGKRGRWSIDPDGEIPWWTRVAEAKQRAEE